MGHVTSLAELVKNGIPQTEMTIAELRKAIGSLQLDLDDHQLTHDAFIIGNFDVDSPLFNIIVFCGIELQKLNEDDEDFNNVDPDELIIDIYVDNDMSIFDELRTSRLRFDFLAYDEYRSADELIISNDQGFDFAAICIHRKGNEDDYEGYDAMLIVELSHGGLIGSSRMLRVHDDTMGLYANA